MKKKKYSLGFTLAELLIVVAIIAVLVAISIPIFIKQSEKAKESVDITNMRNAYALLSLDVISDEVIDNKPVTSYTSNNPLYYDGSKLTSTKPNPYGKGTSVNGNTTYSACNDYNYDSSLDYTNSVIVAYYQDNQVHIHWDNTNSNNTNTGDFNNGTTTINIADKTFTASIIPNKENLGNDDIGTIKTGNIYSYKGSFYIANTDHGINSWTCPDSTDSSYIYTQYSGRVVQDTNTYINVGDIYNDGNNLYIRKYAAAPLGQWNKPTTNDNNWQIITSN